MQRSDLDFMVREVLALANDKMFNQKNLIILDSRQRMNLFILTNAAQSLLMLNKRKIDDSKCVTMIKHLVKTAFATLI